MLSSISGVCFRGHSDVPSSLRAFSERTLNPSDVSPISSAVKSPSWIRCMMHMVGVVFGLLRLDLIVSSQLALTFSRSMVWASDGFSGSSIRMHPENTYSPFSSRSSVAPAPNPVTCPPALSALNMPPPLVAHSPPASISGLISTPKQSRYHGDLMRLRILLLFLVASLAEYDRCRNSHPGLCAYDQAANRQIISVLLYRGGMLIIRFCSFPSQTRMSC